MGGMKFFLDTEFAEDGIYIAPISLALVAEDGRELYLINSEFDTAAANQWVRDNVLPKLPPRDTKDAFGRDIWVNTEVMRTRVIDFVRAGGAAPELWAYYADYDWVLFCQLFGTMMDLPSGFPMLCLDLKQYAYHLGFPIAEHLDATLVPTEGKEHDALEDARWCKRLHACLEEIRGRHDYLEDLSRRGILP